MLAAYARMGSRSKHDIEAAIGQLTSAVNEDPNCVPVLLALAHGHMLLKQPAKVGGTPTASPCCWPWTTGTCCSSSRPGWVPAHTRVGEMTVTGDHLFCAAA